MATSRMKWPKRIIKGLVAVVMLYLVAALFGSILPANQFWKSPDDGIELFIETNGVHTGIIMPVQTDVHDWSELVRPEHMGDPTRYGSHILVGWGHEGVYRNAEYWQDLRFKDAASAVFGSDDVLLHIYHLNYPQTYPHYRRSFRVSEAEYRLIVAAIKGRFVLDESGQPIPSKGYGQSDLFYKSQGHYNAFYTCNSWTSDVLRKAGIRTGIWTPFQGGVMRWFLE
ncbi:MAG: TIGR02117 family protein [Parasphingorhabdus sp.]